MADEFSTGVRAQKQRIAAKARSTVPYADTKPEALIRYEGEDQVLVRTLDSIRRTLETLGGARGARQDHGVTYRGLEAALKNQLQVIERGSTGLYITRNTAVQGVGDAAAAQATADEALTYAALAHTGEVTSPTQSKTLSLDVTAITNQLDVVAEPADDVVIHDDSASAMKKVNLSSITDAGYF